MANTTLQMLDDFALEKLDEQNELTFKNKKRNLKFMKLTRAIL